MPSSRFTWFDRKCCTPASSLRRRRPFWRHPPTSSLSHSDEFPPNHVYRSPNGCETGDLNRSWMGGEWISSSGRHDGARSVTRLEKKSRREEKRRNARLGCCWSTVPLLRIILTVPCQITVGDSTVITKEFWWRCTEKGGGERESLAIIINFHPAPAAAAAYSTLTIVSKGYFFFYMRRFLYAPVRKIVLNLFLLGSRGRCLDPRDS